MDRSLPAVAPDQQVWLQQPQQQPDQQQQLLCQQQKKKEQLKEQKLKHQELQQQQLQQQQKDKTPHPKQPSKDKKVVPKQAPTSGSTLLVTTTKESSVPTRIPIAPTPAQSLHTSIQNFEAGGS